MNKQLLKSAWFLLALVVITIVIRSVLLHGIPVVKLDSAPPLANEVSQALGVSGSSTTLPIAGTDYNIKTVEYLEGGDWAVATVVPVHSTADTVLVVLEKISGAYQVVIDPSNTFSNSYRYTLPAGVTDYLNQQGVLNG